MTGGRALTLDGPGTADGLRVCAHLCSTCVFRPGSPMRLRHGRLRNMVDTAKREDSAIVCHKTLFGERAVCRGYWERHRHDTLMTRLGLALGTIDVDPDLE